MTPRCEHCHGRGRIAGIRCLACGGTGSDGTAWVARLLGIPTTVRCDCDGKCEECECTGETIGDHVAAIEEAPAEMAREEEP